MEKKKGFKLDILTMVVLAILIATEIVLNRFLSINTWDLKIGLSFVPVVIAAMLFGPIGAAIVGGVGDLIGAWLFPIGAYFPGFTLTAVLMGIVWGAFLYNKTDFKKITIAVLINQFILGLIVNTFWISILYGSSFEVLLATRVTQAAVLTAVQIVTIYALSKAMPRIKEQFAKVKRA